MCNGMALYIYVHGIGGVMQAKADAVKQSYRYYIKVDFPVTSYPKVFNPAITIFIEEVFIEEVGIMKLQTPLA